MSASRQVEGADVPAAVLYELPVSILILNSSGELRVVTRRAEELLGLGFDEIAQAFREPESSQLGVELQATIRSSERPEPQRFELERADGSSAVIEGTATQLERSTGLPVVLIALEDVSERARRQRAEREFVTNAAHELQTPLAAITSAIQVLQAGAKDDVVDRERFLAHAEDACGRLERLARALLVLARAQSGEPPRQEIIPVAALLSTVADGVARGRDVEVECPADVAVLANRPLLEQALANLCQNAVKHSHGPIVLAGTRSEGFVQIEVRDRGGGIAEADRERVFQRFYRGSDPEDGFGVGLAIVKEAVAAIDGELELETSRFGTNVAIRLPGARIVSE